MVTRRIRGRSGAALAALALVAAPRAAHADGFELQTLQAAPAGDRFLMAPDGGVAGDGVFYARLLASYAYKPLLRRVEAGQTRDLVSSQLYFDLGGAYAIGRRGLVGADLPLVAAQGVDDATGRKSAGLGDLRLTGRFAIVSTPELGFGVEGRLWLPTGSTDALAGDGAVRGSLHLAVSGAAGPMRYAASAGFLARKRETLGAAEIGPAIPFAVAAGVALLDERLFVGPELSGATVVGGDTSFLATRTTPMVALLGARYRAAGPFVVGLAGGAGLTSAPGVAPRVMLSLGWEPAPEPTAPPEPEPAPAAKPAEPPPEAPPPPPPPPPAPEPDVTHMIPGAPPPPPADAPPPPPPPETTPPTPPPDDTAIRDQARQLFKDGVLAYDAKRYPEAIAAFEKAYKMKPHPIVLLNLAQSELKAGLLEAACLHFKTWKASAESPTPAVVKQVNEGMKGACH